MNEQGTVFLVDDEPAVVRALARFLRANGYRAETFNSGQDFMDRFKASGSGCLVMDVSMPGISGLDVQNWLVNTGRTIPIIFLTAQDELPKHIQAATVLKKPATASVLLKAIEEALK